MGYDFSWISGRRLDGISRRGEDAWDFRFGDDAEIRADSPWRLVSGGVIALSGADDGHRYGLPAPVDAGAECLRRLGGSVVRSAEVREGTQDIVVRFESGDRLEILPLSSGYESWQVAGPGGALTIAIGGGGLATWGRPA